MFHLVGQPTGVGAVGSVGVAGVVGVVGVSPDGSVLGVVVGVVSDVVLSTDVVSGGHVQ